MHPSAVRAEIKRLIAAGVNDCEISRRTGIPRSTVRDLRRAPYRRKTIDEVCPRCWRPSRPIRFSDADYAESLGFYLGDGSIAQLTRTQRMRIALDTKYPRIIESARSLLARCFPENPVDVVHVRAQNCVQVSVYSSHLACVFPQHGPGKKHERAIRLEKWQQRAIDSEPWAFIRACIWTDGCSFINRTQVHREQPYEYLSYGFTNKSADIVALLRAACERVGVFTRVTSNSEGTWQVRINRRPSVALMLQHVGRKA